MRKLGMGKNASKTAQAQWNNMARAQEEYQKSHRGIESAVAPVLSNKNTAPAASSSAIAKSKNSDSGTVRIVNGVRVTGSTTRRSLDYGAPGRAAPKGPRQADRSAECSGESLECSCSLYHSHHFPGQPVNRDVLARVERREDAIMASLRMEEETMQHKDMVRLLSLSLSLCLRLPISLSLSLSLPNFSFCLPLCLSVSLCLSLSLSLEKHAMSGGLS